MSGLKWNKYISIFRPFKVVDRDSETQLQVGENLKSVMGLVKLKKNQKSEKNSDWSDPKHPPAYPFFLK